MLASAAIVLVCRELEATKASPLATVGAAGAIASAALAGALQAVDGIALKSMVDLWAAASGPEKTSLFAAALATRRIEIGLASITSLLFGTTASIVGAALVVDARRPRWLGVLGLAGGTSTAVAGIVIAASGFSGPAMTLNLLAGLALILWLAGLGLHAWRHS